jgi:hypothetical protein
MKTEEKSKKQLWRRGNVLDFAIALLILAAIATIGYRYYRSVSDSPDESLKNFVMTYEVKEAPLSLAESVKPDQKIYMASSQELLGTAIDVSVENADDTLFEMTVLKGFSKGEDGTLVTVELPNANLTGGLICQGVQDESGAFLLNGRIAVTPGQVITVYTETAEYTLTVLTLSTWEH